MDLFYQRTIFSLARKLAIIPMLIAVLMIVDEFIPQTIIHSYIKDKYMDLTTGEFKVDVDKYSIEIEADETLKIYNLESADIKISKIFKRIVYLKTKGNTPVIKELGMFHKIQLLTFFPLLLFSAGAIYFIKPSKSKTSYKFDFYAPWAIIMLLLSLFTSISLLVENKI